MGRVIDLSGQTFGRLTVIRSDGHNKSGRTMWLCQCVCGNIKSVSTKKLRSGDATSCGCYHRERLVEAAKKANTKHGMADTRLFNIWVGMRKRCNARYHIQYDNYGGRGIKVCDEWNEFINFYTWAISSNYSKELTLDRIDVNGDYCPGNCRWATYTEQERNKSNNHILTYNGESHCVSEWSELVGIPKDVLYARLKIGWSDERTLTTPVRKVRRKEKLKMHLNSTYS